jgi:hypothetical protein
MRFLSYLIFALYLVLFITATPSVATDVPWRIPKEARFRPDGTVRVDPKEGQYETGTYRGVKYRIWFKGGHAAIAGSAESKLDIGPYKEEKPVSFPSPPPEPSFPLHDLGNRQSLREYEQRMEERTQRMEERTQRYLAESGRRLHAFVEESARQWHISCDKDPLYDIKSCLMSYHALYIRVSAVPGVEERRVGIAVGFDNHAPGSVMAIRMNDEPPFVADAKVGFDVTTSALILQKLSANPKVLTRYTKRQDSYPTDERLQIFGFAEAYECLHWIVQHMK